MKVIGVVGWTNRDKNGTPIAGVVPLVEENKGEWRNIDANEEFPSQGQVFWFAAQQAVADALVKFKAEENPGQKDRYRVVDPEFVLEVLDLRRFGNPTAVRAALVAGVRLFGPVGTVRAFLWCGPDVMVGPVDLARAADSTVRLRAAALPRVPLYDRAGVRTLVANGRERLIRVEDRAPSGFVDWDDDGVVLRRAIEVAVRVAKQEGRDTGQTKKQIEDAARVLVSQGVGAEAQLDRYRLERALEVLKDTGIVTAVATEIADILRGHPAVEASLDSVRANVRAEIEKTAKDDVERQLARERATLKEITDAQARSRAQLETTSEALHHTEERLRQLQGEADSAAREAESAIAKRIQAVLDQPLDLLAEVSVLRPFLGAAKADAVKSGSADTVVRVDWSGARGDAIKDKASLRRILTSVARGRGVDPSLMFHIHAAVAARLTPVTLGPVALMAITAYGSAACGGRFTIIHVSPTAIQPHDLDEAPEGGILAAVAAAENVDGISLVVLEGANRSPLEASVMPLLQLTQVGMSPLSSAAGLRVAITMVAGATTVPVTAQLWSHAVAIYPEPVSPSPPASTAGDVALSSELLVPGDEPTELIDALLDTWPDCRELRPTMCRFGSALSRLYDEESRLTEALQTGLVLPYLASALTVEEQADALSKAGDTDGTIAVALRRLRKTIA